MLIYHLTSSYSSQWGNNLRKCYQAIGGSRKHIPGTPFIAVTATATQETEEKVLQSLEMTGAKRFKESISRTNLKLKVEAKKTDVIEQLHSIIEKDFQGQTGIIYMQKTDECRKVCEGLRAKGVKATCYFGPLKSEEKIRNQAAWMDGSAKWMVATSAFGAGVDKIIKKYKK